MYSYSCILLIADSFLQRDASRKLPGNQRDGSGILAGNPVKDCKMASYFNRMVQSKNLCQNRQNGKRSISYYSLVADHFVITAA
jgi:hypothetical protein